MKHLLIPVILTVSCDLNAQTLTSPLCRAQFAGRYAATIDYGDRTLTVIGWEHPEVAEKTAVVEAFERAIGALERNDCAGGIRTLGTGLAKAELSRRRTVLASATLDRIHLDRPLSTVSKEVSPEVWAVMLTEYPRIDGLLTKFAAICGPRARTLVQSTRELVFGPELAFASAHPGVLVKPVESRAAVEANRVDFQRSTRLDFDDQTKPLARTPAFRAVTEALFAERAPTEAEIENLARVVGGNQARTEALIRHDVEIWQARVRGAYRRNDEIVKNVGAVRGSSALVIGFRHVPDLMAKLERACRATLAAPATGPAAAATSAR